MSRIGKLPVNVPEGVEVRIERDALIAKGPKGEIATPLPAGIRAEAKDGRIHLHCDNLADKALKSRYGLTRALLANAVTGVSQGFERALELKGVGYRAQVQGRKLVCSLGFSHPVEYEIPEGVDVHVEGSRIVVRGKDKQQVGQVAAEIRAFRPPEPYKGKGARYVDERIMMKEGKKG